MNAMQTYFLSARKQEEQQEPVCQIKAFSHSNIDNLNQVRNLFGANILQNGNNGAFLVKSTVQWK
jgi:hypothetical protein